MWACPLTVRLRTRPAGNRDLDGGSAVHRKDYSQTSIANPRIVALVRRPRQPTAGIGKHPQTPAGDDNDRAHPQPCPRHSRASASAGRSLTTRSSGPPPDVVRTSDGSPLRGHPTRGWVRHRDAVGVAAPGLPRPKPRRFGATGASGMAPVGPGESVRAHRYSHRVPASPRGEGAVPAEASRTRGSRSVRNLGRYVRESPPGVRRRRDRVGRVRGTSGASAGQARCGCGAGAEVQVSEQGRIRREAGVARRAQETRGRESASVRAASAMAARTWCSAVSRPSGLGGTSQTSGPSSQSAGGTVIHAPRP